MATAWSLEGDGYSHIVYPQRAGMRENPLCPQAARRVNRSEHRGATPPLPWCVVESDGGPDHDAGSWLNKPEVSKEQSQQQPVCFTDPLRCVAEQKGDLHAEKPHQHLPPRCHQCCGAGSAPPGSIRPCRSRGRQAGGDPGDCHLRSSTTLLHLFTMAALVPFPYLPATRPLLAQKNEIHHLCHGLQLGPGQYLWVLALWAAAIGCLRPPTPRPAVIAVPCPLSSLSA